MKLLREKLINPKVLIIRTIGGLGDALSCTPSIYKYIDDNKNRFDISVAFPKYTHPLFKGWLKPLDSGQVDLKKYVSIIKLSDPCPAAVYENTHREGIKFSRIQLFGTTFGYNPLTFENVIPYYNLMPELDYINVIRKLKRGIKVGIGLHSNENYRNYTKMNELIELLNSETRVKHLFLFGEKLPDNYKKHEKHTLFLNKDIRHAVAAQATCNLFIAVDSFFLHSAAAVNIPIILLEGPLANDFRFKGYPVERINSGKDCIPCWRNGDTPCKHLPLDSSRSLCMEEIEPVKIMEAVNAKFDKLFIR